MCTSAGEMHPGTRCIWGPLELVWRHWSRQSAFAPVGIGPCPMWSRRYRPRWLARFMLQKILHSVSSSRYRPGDWHGLCSRRFCTVSHQGVTGPGDWNGLCSRRFCLETSPCRLLDRTLTDPHSKLELFQNRPSKAFGCQNERGA
jgi:hypothetical protein